MRIALLWATKDLGIYANKLSSELFSGVGHNNGNLAFVYAVAKQIVGEIKFMSWSSSPKALRESADVIVIPCANQLGAHTDLAQSAENLLNAGLPVVAIGLGAQAKNQDEDITLTDGTLSWLKAIAHLSVSDAPNMYARGAYTYQQIEKLGVNKALVGGCPSHFINESENLGVKIASNWKNLPRRICVAAGHQAWSYSTETEQQLVALVSDSLFPGAYVTQSAQDMLKITRDDFDSIDKETFVRINKYVAPHLNKSEFKMWCRIYAKSFYDVPGWMDFLTGYDITIGHRYHGVALALQAERMGITIAIDSRTAELCSETGVPYIHYSQLDCPITRRNIYNRYVKFDAVKYDELRKQKALNYINFLKSNKLQPAKYLFKIAGVG